MFSFTNYIMIRSVKNYRAGLRFYSLMRISSVNHDKYLLSAKVILSGQQRKYLENPIIQLSKGFLSSKSGEGVPKNLESLVEYEKITEKTMESLLDGFEEILQDSDFKDSDVNYSNGVLTVMIEENYTYVINKQTPNRQIWLSSPISGPKRYDFIDGLWIYKHDGVSLHKLLTEEITNKLKKTVDFSNCSYGKY